ncbi:MAG: hypothetical protein KR126chlam1_00566 [Chlamydiae bacterium]|nr:hypothetical protein [Chlamydiota bacterium]
MATGVQNQAGSAATFAEYRYTLVEHCYTRLLRHNVISVASNSLGWAIANYGIKHFLNAEQVPNDWHLQKLSALIVPFCENCPPDEILKVALIFSAIIAGFTTYKLTKRAIQTHSDPVTKNHFTIGLVNGIYARALGHLATPLFFSIANGRIAQSTFFQGACLVSGFMGAYFGFMKGDLKSTRTS